MNKSNLPMFCGILFALGVGVFIATHDWNSPESPVSKTNVTLTPTPEPAVVPVLTVTTTPNPTPSPQPTATVSSQPIAAPTSTPQPIPSDALAEIQSAVGANIVSLAQDKDGFVWIGTEGAGVFRFDEQAPKDHRITRYWSRNSALPDDCIYGVCIDKENRVWVGHLNHGVSVFNGTIWQNYNDLDGPIGEHIYAMACCPKDGSVWMATNAGLSRYIPESDSWQSLTTEDGLPEPVITGLDFDPTTGDLLAGFKTKGVAISRFSSGYSKWSYAPFSPAMTLTARGDGLPTGMINDVLVTKDSTFYAATTQGLAWSIDDGKTWKFERGSDWADKVQRLINPPAYFNAPSKEELAPLLPQDYIASLAELPDGNVALGLWGKGLASFNLKEQKCSVIDVPKFNNKAADFVNKLLVLNDGRLMSSTYGVGLYLPSGISGEGARPAGGNLITKLPSFARAASLDQILILKEKLVAAAALKGSAPRAVLLSEDWNTQGQWLGRYGRYWACLCGALSPDDYVWGAGDQPIPYKANISQHHAKGDYLRYWINDLFTTRPGSLEMPPPYLHGRVWRGYSKWTQDRRQAEWDDHGESYPRTFDGPHVRCNFTIPRGQFILSYYTINENGQSSSNRFRDYRVTLRDHQGSLDDVDTDFQAEAELSASRTTRFCGGGCYTRWLLAGPGSYTIEINRNYSFNTFIAALMLDQPDELPAPYLESWEDFHNPVKQDAFEARYQVHSYTRASPDVSAAILCLEQLRLLERNNPEQFAKYQVKAYRLLASYLRVKINAPSPVVEAAYRETLFHLGCFECWEKLVMGEFGTTPRTIEKSIRMQQDIQGDENGREFVERYAGYKPILPRTDAPPKENKLSER